MNTLASEFFENSLQAFCRAADTPRGTLSKYFEISNIVFCIRFAGSCPADVLCRSIRHLEVSEQEPSFVIYVWDKKSTGISLPKIPLEGNAVSTRKGVSSLSDDRFLTYVQGGSDTLSLLDRSKATGLFYCHSIEELPVFEVASPFRVLLEQLLSLHGIMLLHAASVGVGDKGVLLVGKSGSGKSTTSFRCLASDLSFAGDDYVCIQQKENNEVSILSLYCLGKIFRSDLEQVPGVENCVVERRAVLADKVVIDAVQYKPARVLKEMILKGVVLPRVGVLDESSLEPANRADAMLAVAPSTIFQSSLDGETEFHKLAALLNCTPVFNLNLGKNASDVPKLVADTIAGT